MSAIQDQWHQFMTATYGTDYVFRAPETFPPMTQWMCVALSGNNDGYAQKLMDDIVAEIGGAS